MPPRRELPPITLHGQAEIVSDEPLCVATPATAWSYAASFPVEGESDREVVVELLVRLREGSAGVSYVDQQGQNLRHEVPLSASSGVCRVRQVVQPDERGMVMIRTGAADRVAIVEVHDVGVRSLTAEEAAAADAPPVLAPVEGWNAFYGNYAQSVPEQVRSLRYGRMESETQRKWIEGLSLIVAPHEQISRAVYVSGLYEPDTALVLKSWLRPGATFLDIGANIGLFTMLGARWVGDAGRVIAVEPSPRERDRLTAHLRLNTLHNVDVVAAAVADREGSGELMVATSEHSGLNTLARRFPYAGVKVADRLAVPLVTLDSLVERAGLHRVDVIKLDIEGGEYAALEGAAAVLGRFRPRLIIEVVPEALSASGASEEQLRGLLERAGYELFGIDDRGALRRMPEMRPLPDRNLAAIPRESVQT